jgi:protein-S-isoprenylcysteine O-methyltransferase Ste14
VYLAFVAILLGISILLRSLSPYMVVVVFVVMIDLTFIRVEEQMLAEQFGEEWAQYRSRAKKWL